MEPASPSRTLAGTMLWKRNAECLWSLTVTIRSWYMYRPSLVTNWLACAETVSSYLFYVNVLLNRKAKVRIRLKQDMCKKNWNRYSGLMQVSYNIICSLYYDFSVNNTSARWLKVWLIIYRDFIFKISTKDVSFDMFNYLRCQAQLNEDHILIIDSSHLKRQLQVNCLYVNLMC